MVDVPTLSSSRHLSKVALYARWAPEAYRAFQHFQQASFKEGALSVREKELIAVGCAHVLRCPYCIDHHVKLALGAGATRKEMAESVWVAVAMGAGACFAHSAIAANILEGRGDDYYARAGLQAERAPFAELVPEAQDAYAALETAAFQEGALPRALKELVAVACAHNTRCPICIDAHVGRALSLEIPRARIAEAVWVAIEMGAGACLGHAGLTAALLEEGC